MKTKIIANSFPIFSIGLGAMPLSIAGRPSTTDAINVLQTFIELGGNFIDTADVYGLDDTDRGHNERLIRKSLKEMGKNNNVFIATKGGATRPGGGWGLRGGGHPKKLRKACENSLTNLGLSQIDLYYLHGPDPDVPLQDSLEELVKLKEEGKIKNIGIANVNLKQLKTANELTTIAAVQNRCNPFCKDDFKNGVIEFCKLNQIVYVPYCPLGGWSEHGKLASSTQFQYFTTKYNVSSYEICLSWLVNKCDHIIPIPGMDRVEQISSNFHSLEVQIEENDIQKIDEFPNLYSPVHLDI